MIIVLVVTVEKHVSSVGGLKKYFSREYFYLHDVDVRRRLELSQMSQQAHVSHRILKLDSKCLGSLHFMCLALNKVRRLDDFLSSITNTIYFLVTYYTLLTPIL